jgi:hypothetical protein
MGLIQRAAKRRNQRARSFKNQMIIIIGSLIVTGILLAISRSPSSTPSERFSLHRRCRILGGLSEGTFNGVYCAQHRGHGDQRKLLAGVIIAAATSSIRSRSSTTATSA